MKKILLVLLLFIFGNLQAEKYNLSFCAVFHNEAPYLKEWLEYHLLVGVDHFYLYDDSSADNYREVLAPYIQKGIVTLIKWPIALDMVKKHRHNAWTFMVQVPAFEHASKYLSVNETKWLALMDVNEFMVPLIGESLVEVLNKFPRAPGVVLSSDCFDAFQIDAQLSTPLVIESSDLISEPYKRVTQKAEKTIFQPKLLERFEWPPYRCVFAGREVGKRVGRHVMRVNRYVNRYKGEIIFARRSQKIVGDNRYMLSDEISAILEAGYSLEDQEKAIYRFLPDVSSRLQRTVWR